MWWLVTLLVLALVSFLIIKSMKSSTQNKQIEHDATQQDRLDRSANPQSASAAETAPESSVADSGAAVAGTAANTARQAVAGDASGLGLADSPATVVSTGETLSDVREMIKILNLDGPDAARLDISKEQLTALRKGNSSGIPDASSLENVAARLRRMLA